MVKVNKYLLTGMFAATLMCLMYSIYTYLGISDEIPTVTSCTLIAICSIYIMVSFKNECKSSSLFWILLLGYGARLLCMIIDLYGRNYMSILHSGADSEGFFSVSCQYYEGDYSVFYTSYPYVLRFIYGIFGKNRLIAQYINIFFWFLSVMLIIRVCDQFQVMKKDRYLPYAVMAFWPNNIFLSSILMRESMMIFFDTLSFYFFVCWMKKGNIRRLTMAFLAVLPALWLHIASVALWVAYVLMVSVWNVRRQKIVIPFQIIVKLLLYSFILFLFCVVTGIWDNIMARVPMFSLYNITHGFFEVGGSDYLRGMDCRNWYEFILYTIIRMSYFVFSPMPWEIRRIYDLVAFVIDSVPIFLVTTIILYGVREKKQSLKGCKGYIIAGLLCCLALVGIYAWGVGNAGTAMRHRTMLIGIWVMTYCISRGNNEKTHRENLELYKT